MKKPRCFRVVLLALAGSSAGSFGIAEGPATETSHAVSPHRADSGSPATIRTRADLAASRPPIRDLLEVTAASTSFVALDHNGRVVRDLGVDEVTVSEDGSPARVLSLERRRHAAAPAAAVDGSESDGTLSDGNRRVVVFVSAALGDRRLYRSLGRRVQAETGRLTEIGPVDVVVADPEPVVLTTRERRPREVCDAVRKAISKASGASSVAGVRRKFANEFKPGAGFERGVLRDRASSGGIVVRTRNAMQRERLLIHDDLEHLAVWLQNQPPVDGGVLVWITSGFDLDPGDFYIPMVEQIDPFVARTLRSSPDSYRLDHDLQWVIETALSLGWTVVPVTCGGNRFVFGADIDGGAGLGARTKQSAASLASHGADFATDNPQRSLRIVAAATGGHLVADDRDLAAAVEHLEAAYVVSYQVDRPLDGRLHELEVRCSRPGVRICCGRHRVASGTPRGVAMGRALRLLSGEPVAGAHGMSARVANVGRNGNGTRVGDLVLTADLGELKTALGPLGLGEMRVTVVVEMAGGAPFVYHEEIKLDWRQVEDVWRYTARLDWPKQARNLAVVAEELVSSTWGAALVALR